MNRAYQIVSQIDEIDDRLKGLAFEFRKEGTGFDPTASNMDDAFAGLGFTREGRRMRESEKHRLTLEKAALQQEFERLPSKLKEGLDDA